MLNVNSQSKFSVKSSLNAFIKSCIKDFKINKSLYVLIIPVVVYYILFQYKPMYGIIIAFKNFNPSKGILGSPWIGMKYFQDFVSSIYFVRTIKNTIVISMTSLLFGFPTPIILALLINELKNKLFTKWVQTISYLPHFISIVVICGMILDFTRDTGVIGDIIAFFGGTRTTLLNSPKNFVPVYVFSGIWQEMGWGSIIYLAALAGIDQELYEASKVDGANKWKQTIHITIPGILPTIVVLLILRIGNMLNVGFEKIILLYNPVIYETADVISSLTYRKGLLESNFSYSAEI